MADIWREKVPVRFGSVDRSDRLTLWSVFDYFQEAAISHAVDLGVGRDAMARTGQAWVLSRISIIIGRRPAYGEIVEVSTWPRSREKLFAVRDYAITDARGDMVVRGRGAWLILDIEKRRPLRVKSVMDSLPVNDGIDAFCPEGASRLPAALAARENLSKHSARTARYSDIDFYGHANNARYIQWIQDAADMDILTNTSRARLDINYLSEVMPGDTVEIWKAPIDDGNAGPAFAFEGRRPAAGGTAAKETSPGQAVFRAELRAGEG